MSATIKRFPSDVASQAHIARLFDDVRRRLVETGTRNRLVHVNRANTRGDLLNIVDGRPDNIFAALSGGRAMQFVALNTNPKELPDEFTRSAALPAKLSEPGRSRDNLVVRTTPEALERKLLKIAREAQTAEEESGVNILYLALGFLTWFEADTSKIRREAPLVLLPVELKRNQRTSTYDLKLRDEEVFNNLPLQQRLQEDFGIALPSIDIDDDWTPTAYYSQVSNAVSRQSDWEIDPEAIQLGFFSFSKLLMYRDLDINAWPAGAVARHALTRSLLFEGFSGDSPLFHDSKKLDDILPPEKLFHVVDADASQTKVIEEVRSGRNLVVQGPPGTGKSQTITNIIASAVRDGKRVLFLAEKMAALSVVHQRLVKVGLADICLELHSRSASKKTVLAEIARTIAQGTTILTTGQSFAELTRTRDRLNDITEVLHSPLEGSGETPISALGMQARFMGAGVRPPRLKADRLASMTRAREAELLELIGKYGNLLAKGQGSRQHPFKGVRNLDLQPVDLARLVVDLTNAIEDFELFAPAFNAAMSDLGMTMPKSANAVSVTIDLLQRLEGFPAGKTDFVCFLVTNADRTRLMKALEAASDWQAMQVELEKIFAKAAFGASVDHLRANFEAGCSSIFSRWSRAYRRSSRELAELLHGGLPKSPIERMALIDKLISLKKKRAAWQADAEYCSETFGDAWRHERTDFSYLISALRWCDRLAPSTASADLEKMLALAARPQALACHVEQLNATALKAILAIQKVIKLLDLDTVSLFSATFDCIPLEAIVMRFQAMLASRNHYASWVELSSIRTQLADADLSDLTRMMEDGEIDGGEAILELRFARAEAIWRHAFLKSNNLRVITKENRHRLVADYAALERRRLSENVSNIVAQHRSQLPQGAQGEMGIIRSEIARKRGHMAIRKLFERAGSAVQRIKPVLLMSPVSVAQYLPPGALTFDLLVMDEASQVRPEDALGAIARANQLVVVGDQKQLPPSSFFDRVVDGIEEQDAPEEVHDDPLSGAAKAGEMESILTLCEARGLGSRMLTWHYRSRDPSLIAVSNQEFYENKLILPPSPSRDSADIGLRFTRVEGVYDRGGKRDNRVEGNAIVARVTEHAYKHSDLSLGIVTFSSAQRNTITELLEMARRTDEALDHLLREGQAEDVFVKNIENVQGDERDVILISVGYGPTVAGGRLASMSFGPVNTDGGERRLNVLFTRARVRCEVFASFDPGDIDLSRTSSEGPRILKRFLDFAKSGQLDEKSSTGLSPDSPLEEDIMDVIRSLGFLADPQVGSAGFRLDIGVRHPDRPGEYILAVECDGATYHSALWARERDRLRQDVLENLGWRFHRIWSTDWFYNRPAEIDRLKAALEAARSQAMGGNAISGANRHHPTSEHNGAPKPVIVELPPAPVRQMPLYKRAVFQIRSGQEPHELPVAQLSSLAKQIVGIEGPIHTEEIARRVAASFGKERTGSRIMQSTMSALLAAKAAGADLLFQDDFWFTRIQAEQTPVRDRTEESGPTLKAALISDLEIKAAVKIARNDNAGGDDEETVRTVARLLGFRRVGHDLEAKINRNLV